MARNIFIKILFLTLILGTSLITKAQTNELDSLKNVLKDYKKNDTNKVNLLNKLAYNYYSVDINKVYDYAKESNKIANKINFIKGEAESLRLFGIYYLVLTDYDKSLEYFEKALVLNNKIKFNEGIAMCYNNIGSIYTSIDDYSRALDFYQKSLIIEDQLKNESGIQKCYNNIGLVYTYMFDYSKALDYHLKAIKISEKLNYQLGIAYGANNLGNVYSELNDNAKALEWYEKSLKISKELGLEYNVANILNNIGIIKKDQNDYDGALKNIEQALMIFEKSEIKNGIANSYDFIGNIYFHKKEYNKAFNYINKSITIAKEIDAKQILRNSTEQLAKFYALTNNYKKAYENYIIFKELNDSIHNREKIKEITALEYTYKFEKEKEVIKLKQQKKDAIITEEFKRQRTIKNILISGFILLFLLIIIILSLFFQKRNANLVLKQQKIELEETYKQLLQQKEEIYIQANELELKNIKLTELNNTKNKFFSIVSHDLKNPFNALLVFSELLEANFDKFDKAKQKKYIGFISESANSSYKLLENLLTWSRTQMGKVSFSPLEQNASELISEVISQYKQVADKKNIIINNHIPKELDAFVDKDMFLTVLRNLISNAIKFSNKGGIIEINSKIEQDLIEFSVIDNGVGIPKEDLSKLFSINEKVSTKGTDDESGTGLGLILCKEFVEKHGGTIKAESEIGEGSKFIFTIPKKS